MSKETGGPAFPVHGGFYEGDDPRNQILGGGASLRDYFAGKAMQGWMVGTEHPHAENIAKTAYQVADAMIAERSK